MHKFCIEDACSRKKIQTGLYMFSLFLAFSVAVFTRTYALVQIPYGVHADEAGMAYDAWSLANYGVDRYQKSFPVYFINYGGGQNALATYLCMILVKLSGGGISPLLMRLPSVIVNLCAYLAGIWIIKKIMGRRWSVIAAMLLAVMPYFIMQCRFGLESSLLVNMLTISVCLLMLANEKRKYFLFILAGISWGLSYYAYALSYIPNTLLLLILMIGFLYYDRKLWKGLLLFCIPVFILGCPLALMLVVNQFDLPEFQIGCFTITKLPGYRGSEVVFSLSAMLGNLRAVMVSTLKKDWMPYNAFERWYTMYGISIFFIFAGLLASIKDAILKLKARKLSYGLIWLAVYCCYFFMGLLLGGDGPNVNRMNGIFFAQFYFLIYGLRWFFQKLRRIKYLSPCAALLVGAIYTVDFLSFGKYYFTEYSEDVYPQFLFYTTYSELLECIKENHLEQCEVYIENDNRIYYALSAGISPAEYLELSEGVFSDIILGLPDEYVEGALYIISDYNTDFPDKFPEYVKERKREGMYVLYF